MLILNMKKFYIKTFGCQMNMHDSEKAAGILKKEGMEQAESHEDTDIIIFNTCSIRQKAEQKFFSELGRLKRLKKKRPGLKIMVMGCIAQQMGEKIFKKAGHIDCIIGPQNIHSIKDAIDKNIIAALDENPAIAETELPADRKEKGRAWVSIMYGCNNFCTYCVVPYTRGREKSRPKESILKEVKGLADEGYKEITLLGQNVNSYRGEGGFTGLLRELNEMEGIERIRFVTSHPRDLSDGLTDSIGRLEKVCEHIHLPMQSGSDRALSMMNRGYTYREYKTKIDKLRNSVPGIAITSDIIAGFPGETEDDHKDTINALKELEFDGIFAFKFSERPGTKAAIMEGKLPEGIKTERLSEILGLQDEITLKKNKALEGKVLEVLVEDINKGENKEGHLTGRTRGNKIVNFSGSSFLVNKLVRVRIKKGMKHSLLGELLDENG
jgi:tRNA-2-methylthio-N6-dimethylallyladenosine synthase